MPFFTANYQLNPSLRKPAFTLIEILIVIALIALISTIATIGFTGFMSNQTINPLAEDAVSIIRKARENTLASRSGNAYGIYLGNSEITLFTAPTYVQSNPSNEVFNLPQGFEIIDINIANSTSTIIFQKISGVTENSGSFTIRNANDPSVIRVINIYESGTIEIQ